MERMTTRWGVSEGRQGAEEMVRWNRAGEKRRWKTESKVGLIGLGKAGAAGDMRGGSGIGVGSLMLAAEVDEGLLRIVRMAVARAEAKACMSSDRGKVVVVGIVVVAGG